MARIRSRIGRAAAAHRQAVAIAAAAGAALDRCVPRPRSPTDDRTLRELAEQLRAAAARVAPGWLGATLDAAAASTPLGGATNPRFVRIGTAQPLDDARFPAVVPLGHIAFGADCRDARVAGVMQAVLLRLLAATSTGSLLVRAVDATGNLLSAFAPLHDAGIMPPPVTDRARMQEVLTEAEQWVRGGSRTRTLLLVVAAWPQETAASDLARWRTLAANGPTAGLHLVVAGWPPPPLGRHSVRQPLPYSTQVSLRNPHVRVGHPPGGSFAAPTPPGETPSAYLNAKVYLDEAPSADLVGRVCRALADRATDHARVALGDMLPEGQLWTHDAAAGLEAIVGRADNSPVTLWLDDPTPHWLVAGRAGSGKTALLLGLLYGLCSRYGPDQLAVYLLDHTGKGSFADFVPSANDPSQLPHARVVGLRPDPEQALMVLRDIGLQLTVRSDAMRAAGVNRFTDLRATGVALPRILCVIDDYQPLLAGPAEVTALLRSLTHQGGAYGVHTILASREAPAAQARDSEPDPIFGRCRIRIALPGGSGALDPANDAAAGLPLGAAVVNTAGGLGGPRGATRAHEQLVRFPDPYADPVALTGLRHRLWRGAA